MFCHRLIIAALLVLLLDDHQNHDYLDHQHYHDGETFKVLWFSAPAVGAAEGAWESFNYLSLE